MKRCENKEKKKKKKDDDNLARQPDRKGEHTEQRSCSLYFLFCSFSMRSSPFPIEKEELPIRTPCLSGTALPVKRGKWGLCPRFLCNTVTKHPYFTTQFTGITANTKAAVAYFSSWHDRQANHGGIGRIWLDPSRGTCEELQFVRFIVSHTCTWMYLQRSPPSCPQGGPGPRL